MSSADSIIGSQPWAGGENPAPGCKVVVRLREKENECGAVNSESLRWNHTGDGGDIMSYKIIDGTGASAYAALQASGIEFPPIDACMIADSVTVDGVKLGGGLVRIGGAAVGFGVAPTSAPALLQAAATHMADRAATYDKPEGERSMAQTVAVFKAFHGIDLSESQGWHFMQILKDVRLFTRLAYHADSAEDCIAFAALKAEARAKEGGDKSSSKI